MKWDWLEKKKSWRDLPNKLIIVGSAHSGSSLLESYIGGHPDVNMIHEDTTLQWTKGYGKLYNGTKILLGIQVQKENKLKFYGKLYYKMVGKKLLRPFPTCTYSLKDIYAKVIYIKRRNGQLRSLTEKHGITFKQAARYLVEAKRQMDGVEHFLVYYEDLCDNPEEVLKDVCRYLNLPYKKKMLKGKNWVYI